MEAPKNYEFTKIEDLKYYKFGIPAVESLSLYGYGVYQDMQVLDSHVYDMMGRFVKHKITNLSDLANNFKDRVHAYDWWDGVSEGALNKLKGHLAEEYVAEHFKNSGVNVEPAKNINHPGYDFKINGHEVNSKLIADGSQLTSHFDKYPDIPVVVPHDMSHIPDDAIHFDPTTGAGLDNIDELFKHKVLVDDALSNADVTEHITTASNLALGTSHATHAIHGHIPFITIALSGTREINLLMQSKTDVATAMKNVSLDVAGRGVGAFVGAKAGALAGTIFGPIGTAIGGVIGAVAGSKAGASAADSIKSQEFNRALSEYNQAREVLKNKSNELEECTSKEYISLKNTLQDELNKLVEDGKQKVIPIIDELKNISSNKIDRQLAEELLTSGQSELEDILQKLRDEYNMQGFIKKFIWMDCNIIAIEHAAKYIEQLIESIYSEILLVRTSTDEISKDRILSILAYSGIVTSKVKALIESTEKKRLATEKLYQEKIAEVSKAIIEKKSESLKTISKFIDDSKENIQKQLFPYIQNVKLLAEKVKKEAEKLGK